MKRFDDSREELLFLQRALGPHAYVEHAWCQREAGRTWPKSSPAWPYQPKSLSTVGDVLVLRRADRST